MTKLHDPERSGKLQVRPALLGPRNCEAATGLPWRHVRDHARALGVRLVRVGRKLAVPADEFLAALEAANDQADAGGKSYHSADPADAAAEIRRLVGCGR